MERLPVVGNDGATNVPGLRIAGDLTGIPLLKFAADSGVKAVRAFAAELATAKAAPGPDLAIIGGGVSGIAAAIEARRIGISFVVFEASQPFFTIANFPKKKPIYIYPADFKPAGELQMQAIVKEDLLAELEAQQQAAGIVSIPARDVLMQTGSPCWICSQPRDCKFRPVSAYKIRKFLSAKG